MDFRRCGREHRKCDRFPAILSPEGAHLQNATFTKGYTLTLLRGSKTLSLILGKNRDMPPLSKLACET